MPRRPLTIAMLAILLLFLVPILARSVLYAMSDDPRSWRDADWSSTGFLPAATDSAPARVIIFTGTAGVGQERQGISRAGFHAKSTGARCKAEHQQCVRLVLGNQRRQFAVHRRITCRKYVRDDFDVRQSRAAARSSPGEESSRVERCTRERAKSGDEDR